MTVPAASPAPTGLATAAPYRAFGAFRLVLALAVAFQHMLHTLAPGSWQMSLTGYEVGGVAVLLFFVLSGFIICEAAATTYPDRPIAFAANRVLRIVPVYLVALAVTWLVAYWAIGWGAEQAVTANLGHALEDVGLIGFIANALAVLPGGKSLLAMAGSDPLLEIVWALRIEMMFYAIVAAALGIGVLTGIAFTVPLTLVAVALLAADAAGFGPLQHGTFQYACYFVLGGALYFTARAGPGNSSSVPSLIALVATLLTAEHILAQHTVPTSTGYERHELGQLVLFTIGIIVLIVLLKLSQRAGNAAATVIPGDRAMGDLTYALYLIHTAALIAVSALMPERSAGAVLVGFAASLAAAMVVARLIETPLGRLRTRVRGRQ